MHAYIRHIVIVLLMCLFATSAQAAQISVEPTYQEVFQGENVTINIIVYPEGSDVYGASYKIYFNNTLLNATSQTQGPFLTQDSQGSTVWGNVIDNPNGTIEYSESRMGIDFGVTNPGVLTTITFQAIGVEGTRPLGISYLNGELLYATSGSIPTNINNGTCRIVEIDQTSTPVPTTTTTATPQQTPTATSTTPTPTATAIQTPTISSKPSSSPNITESPTSSISQSEEKSNEKNELSGFKATFAVTGLLIVLILKRKNVRK